MSRRPAVLLFALTLSACGGRSDAPSPAEPAPAEPAAVADPADDPLVVAEQQALTRAEDAANLLGERLKAHLMGSVEKDGVASALAGCKEIAPEMTASVTRETGIRVGRTSDRLRNNDNQPPEWVKAWMEVAKTADPSTVVGFERVELEGEERMARVLRPIVIKPFCLNCHGARDTLAKDVLEKLDALYPGETANGYSAGDFRGALWAEAKVAVP